MNDPHNASTTPAHRCFPLSLGQQALWVLYREAPHSTAYHMALPLRFAAPVQTATLARAIDRLAARHGMLRARFGEADGVPYQWSEPECGPQLRLHASLPDTPTLEAALRTALAAPFVLEDGCFRADWFAPAAADAGGGVLLLTLHHLAGDAGSLAVLGRELPALYAAERDGTPPDLPPLPADYPDYVRWETDLLAGPDGARMGAYWQQRLAGAPPVLQLPGDRPRPPRQSFDGGSIDFTLPPPLAAGLRALAGRERATLPSLLLGAFAALLHRSSGQTHLRIGVPTALVRTRPAFAGLVGYLVNPLVFESRLDESAPTAFRTLLAATTRQLFDGLRHQPYPFPLLVERLAPARDPSRSPLIQALFAYEDDKLLPRHFAAAGISAERLDLPQMEGQFDLTLTLVDAGSLGGRLSYDRALFDADTVRRMVGHLECLLAGIVVDPAADIRTLPLLGAAEQAQLIAWNRTETAFPADRTVVDLFEAQVQASPEAVALVFEETQLSYAELNARANRLAHALIERGVGPDVLVALCVERSIDMVVGLLGILKAGGAYVPLDPDYPAERLAFMLADSAAPLLLTQSALADTLPAGGADVILLDAPAAFAERPADNPARRTGPDHLAYAIYTSGSTGRPKGALNAHRGLSNRLLWMQAHFRLTPDEAILQKTPFGFDVSVWEFYWPLIVGARLVLARPGGHGDPAYLCGLIDAQGIGTVHFVPSMLRAFLDAGQRPTALARIVCSGEALGRDLQDACFARLPGVELHNLYGPTEAAVDVTAWRCRDDDPHPTVPIGRAIANTRIHVLDRRLQPTPPGVPGELCIAGVQVGCGYLNRPELTAEKFVAVELFGQTERIYRTGDLARWRPDGHLEYLGRLDHQVKLRGFRIELGEIESVLAQHPQVREAAVVLHEHAGNPALAAYLTVDSESASASPAVGDPASLAAVLRPWLKTRLPDYMVPASFTVLDAFPLTPNGKLDRRALPAPDALQAGAGRPLASETERLLVALWGDVLKTGVASAAADFFALGGHSLLATRLAARIRDAFTVELPLKILFERPTLADLAAWLDGQARGDTLPPIVPQAPQAARVPSYAQQRLWFLAQLEGASATYNIPTALTLRGTLDVAALRRTFQALVARHQSLRLVFPAVEGAPSVAELPADAPLVVVVDLTDLAPAEQPAEVARRARAHALAPFDLAAGPLLRLELLLLSADTQVLLLNLHHIVADGWSMGVLIEDWAALYRAFAQGQAPALAPLPIAYTDYAAWQRAWLVGEPLQRQLDYWSAQLGDAPHLLELPTDRPRPAVQSYRGAHLETRLAPDLTAALKDLGRQRGATLFMTLLAAFATLLQRYSGQDDLLIGSPIANRTASHTEGLIGLFVNTLVLRARLAQAPTFADLLAQVRRTALDAYAHQDLPFEQLVERLDPARTLSHSPLFQVMFVLQNTAQTALELPGLAIEALAQDTPIAKFDLTLSAAEDGDTLALGWEYATDLFEAATVERLAGHFAVLLAGIVAAPDGELSRLPLLTESERAQLAEWNATATAFPADLTLVELFKAQVQASPEAVALVFEDARLTYAELNARANRLAHALIGRGVGPDVLVALCVERSIDMVVGLLGILKAGGAYVPLDPAYPPERLAFMLADSAAPILLTQTVLADTLPTGDAERLLLDAPGAFADRPADNPPRRAGPDHLAYVIYTSGSTGQPKGCLITHRNVSRLFDATAHWFGFGAQDVWTLFHSYAFDFSVWELWGALLYGGRLVIVPYLVSRAPHDLHRLLARAGVTVLNQTPSAFKQLIQADRASDAALSLRYVIFGGEALNPADLKPWFDRHGEMAPRLVNMYGITETTVHVTYHPLAPDAGTGASVIGRPLPDLGVYVLDAQRQPMPMGVPGEMYVGGGGVARGYLNRPALTAERFVDLDLFGRIERVYKTGDLARWRPDGNLEYLGRLDHQVKLRGFRIELGEIESVLAQHPSVREAAVALHDSDGNPALAAYLTVASGQCSVDSAYADPDPLTTDHASLTTALRPWLKSRLPDYMVPASFTVLDAFPLTPNGKLDRKALPAPDAPQSAAGRPLASETERLLAALWGEVLKTAIITREADFFALGGHSLLATRLAARIRDALQVELPLKVLFERPTLGDLAAWLDGQTRGDTLPPIVPQAPEALKVPSYAQQRLWFLAQLEGASATYNMPAALTLHGTLNVDALRRTFQALVARHQSLRLILPAVEGAPSVAERPAYDPLTVVDLRALPPADQPAEVARRARAHATAPFDLAAGPLLRAELLLLAADTQVLLLNLHHIVADGWSIGILIDDWAALYRAFCAGQAPALAPLPIAYTDYAAWQRDWLQGAPLQRQLDYWTEALAGAPHRLELPTDRPRPAVQSYRGAHLETRLDPALTHALLELGRQRGATLFMTLLAAFATLLQRYSGQDDLLIGSPIANRTATHTEGLIGLFVNTLVLRARLDAASTFADLLAQLRRTALNAYAHQDLPFEQLVERLDPARTLSHSPLFQVMFVLQNNAQTALELPGLTVEALAQDTPIAKFDLTLSAVEDGDALALGWEYATDLFDAATIERLAGHFAVLLAGLVAAPDADLRRLPLLTESEDAQLAEWNATATDIPADLTAVDLFEAQVQASPDAVALVFADARLTYTELNQRANRLAHALIERGVGPDVLVALCVERSIDMVVGLLGILKAGGAYVPLDPEYPAERLAFMLADSAAPVLLTQTTLADSLPAGGAERLPLDAPGAFADRPADNPARRAGPGDLAYVIYTSGSTGRPKGVACRHAALVNLALAQIQAFAIDRQSRVLQFASPSFDAAVSEVATALLAGAALHLMTRERLLDADFVAHLSADGITHVTLPPSFAINLPAALPACLRTLVVAGEACPAGLVDRHAPGRRFINAYGPTESTVCATWALCAPGQGNPPIGTPLANTRGYILDARLQPLPIGVPGELCIAGAGLARGYLNRPELTAERFVAAELFGTTERIYRTGDLARWRPDGNLEYLGRLDHQVKLRGFRIELGEIKSVLAQHPSVREAAVVLHDSDGNPALAAYLTVDSASASPNPLTTDHAALTTALRAWLKTRLPHYMVPASFTVLDAFPLTPNGKLDRRALPAPDAPQAAAGRPLASETERLLAALWGDVLKTEVASAAADFFALGGHSLLATRLAARIRDAFQVELPLKILFERPTLGDLAAWLDGQARGAALPPISRQPAPAPLCLSLAQDWFWLLSQYDSDPRVHHIHAAWRLVGALDVAALRRAVGALVARHQSLRLCFPTADGQPRVAVLEPYDPLQVVPFAAPADAERPFDLAAGPLLRLHLIEQGPDERLLLLTVHHIVCDHWSLAILWRELGTLYVAELERRPAPLPPLPIDYTDYAAWQRAALDGAALARQTDYWLEQLRGAPELLALPTDYPRPPIQQNQGGQVPIALAPELTQRLRGLAAQSGCTLQMVLFAAFVLLLHRASGQRDLAVGVPLAMRQRPETEPLVGLLLNLLVLRTRLHGRETFAELLGQVRRTALDAYAHPDLPFAALLERLPPSRRGAYNPYVQVMFNLVNTPQTPRLDLPGLHCVPWSPAAETLATSNLDLVVSLQEGADGIVGRMVFDRALFKTETVQGWAEGLSAVLEQALARPAAPLADFRLSRVAAPRYPLTSAQRGIWLDQLLHAQIPLYNIGGYVEFDGPLDPALFAQAVARLVAKHDALRTRLVAERDADGIPLQIFADAPDPDVSVHDFSAQPDPEAAAQAWMKARFGEPFVLIGGPLFRYDLVKLGARRFFWLAQYHHLIVDGWGLAQLNRSLGEIYTQLAAGLAPDLASPSYVDFIEDDRDYLASAALEKGRAYWLAQYPHPPAPLLQPRRVQTHDAPFTPSATAVLALPRALYDRLEGLAQRHGATGYHVLLAALYVYFARTAQRDELAIGLPALNRANARLRHTVGLCVGVSPVRFAFGTGLGLGALLERIAETLKAGYRYQRCPVADINRAVGLEGTRSRLFDLVLSYERHDHDARFADIPNRYTALLHDWEQTPLTIYVRDFHAGADAKLDFVYNTAYFADAEVQALAARFATILAAAVDTDEAPVQCLPVMTADEVRQLRAWNDTAAAFPTELTLVDLFEAQVRASPDAVALVFEDERLSYAELNERANRLAHALIARGVGPDVLVALCVERSVEMVVGLLGILKAGGAYVPLDPAYPAERLAFMLADSAAPILLTQTTLADTLPASDAERLLLDVPGAFAERPADNPARRARPDCLAYVIYTSGSTGQPKGVAIAHQALANLLLDMRARTGIGAHSRLAALTTLSFDIAGLELYLPLIVGARVDLLDARCARDPAALARRLDADGVDLAQATPATWRMLLDGGWTPPRALTVLCGGEALPVALGQRLMADCRRLWNVYGPTETTIWSTAADAGAHPRRPDLIGRPLANTRIHILDRGLQPLPIGVPGELCIAGAGLARGYLNRPELTAERFVAAELFGTTERIYRTGDLARWRPDGNLEYLGRLDHQVKLRGFRIELGEIKSVLAQHPSVREAAVVLHDSDGNPALAAYLTVDSASASPNPLTTDHAALTTALRAWLKTRLPHYMVPASFTVLDAFPLTPNGKLDRRALPAPDAPQAAAGRPLASETERLLAALWGDVLKTEVASAAADFFALGGHSLLATRLAARIRDAFQVELPLKILFERPTLGDLAAWLDGQARGAALPPISRQPAPAPLCLSLAQDWFWLLSQYDSDPRVHHIHAAWRLVGALDVAALRRAVGALVARHQSLRLCFPTADGQPRVAVLEPYDPLQVVPFAAPADAERPFDLAAGPLLRLHLIEQGPDERLLLLTVHHIVCDHWSLAILWRELGTLYVAELERRPAPLPPLPIDYTDYAAWQRAALDGAALARQTDYWLEQLRGAPELLALPTDYPRPPIQQNQGGQVPIALAPELTQRLRGLAAQSGCTLQMVLFAAFVLLLHRASGQRDLAVGVPLAMRQRPETEPLVGLLLNLLVLRTRLHGRETFAELLGQVRRTALDAYAHPDLPFAALLERLPPSRRGAYNPYVQVMFNLVNTPQTPRLDLPGLHCVPWSPAAETLATSNLDLVVSLQEGADGIVGRMVFDRALFKTETVQGWAEGLSAVLEQALARPAAPLADFRLSRVAAPRYPLTSAQRGIWLDQLLHAQIPLYNIGGYVEFDGPLDPALFAQAVARLVAKHDALRTRLVAERDADGIPLQIFADAPDPDVSVHDFSAQPDPEAAAQAWMKARFGEPFVLIGGPLFRYDLVKLGARRFFWLAQYHHLIVDGWGLAQLNRSLGEIYTQLAAGLAPDLASPSYVDFIEDDRDYLASAALEKGRAYWLAQYPHPPAPLLQPRRVQTHDAPFTPSATAVLALPRALYDRLEGLAQRHGATGYHVLLAALYVYFARTAQRDELAIGLPALNRANARLRHTVGLCVGVSPVRFAFGTGLGLGALLERIAETLKAGYRYQRCPVADINRAVGLEGTRSRLFDLVLSYERHDHDARFADIPNRYTALLHDWEQTPLTIYVRDFHAGADAKLDFVYNTAYFADAEVQALAARFATILAAAVDTDEAPVQCLPVMTADEVRQLRAWNDTAAAFPTELTLVDLFEAQVRASPDAVALVFEDERLSYAELNERANRLAHALIARGVGPDVLVALCVERSIEMVVGLLGILKAGGAYVPLDPDYPAERLAFMLADSAAPILLTQTTLADTLPASDAERLLLDAPDAFAERSADNPARRAGPDDLIYVIYTSGSTGVPKGVCVPHRGVVRLVTHTDYARFDSAQTFLQYAPISFDAATLEIWGALLHGARLVVMPPREKGLAALARVLEQERVTLLWLTASLFNVMIEEYPHSLAGVGQLLVGGEVVSVPHARRARRLLPRTDLINGYGPTENTTFTCCFPIGECADDRAIPIGRPIANTRVFVLDRHDQPLPIGVPGELGIAGAGLARGYLNRPELTAEKFVDLELFGTTERVYRTGDLARWLPDGNLEFLGRIDTQVKLRGFRIELGEIESALAQHPSVREAAVLLREDAENPALAAYLTCTDGTADPAALTAELRPWLKSRLPDYMVPASFTVLPTFPLTPNGKLDRRALPAPDAAVSAMPFAPPRSDTEQRLAALWCEVLGRATVGIHDSFFELGGHSLLVIRIHHRLQPDWPALRVVDLFTYPSIQALAAYLDRPADPPARPSQGDARGAQRRARQQARQAGRRTQR